MSELILTGEDNGTTVAVKPGTTIVIRLEENPATGYAWTVDEVDKEIVAIADVGFQESEEALVGQGGIHTFIAIVKSIGTTDICLHQRRSWEGEQLAIDPFRVTASVVGT